MGNPRTLRAACLFACALTTITGCGNGRPAARCGDGRLDPGEQCETTDPTCNADCTRIVAVCGNHVVEPPEQCDDGNTMSGDACTATCTRPSAFVWTVDGTYGRLVLTPLEDGLVVVSAGTGATASVISFAGTTEASFPFAPTPASGEFVGMDALAVVGDEIVGVGTAGDWTIEDHRGSYGWLRGYTIDGAPSRSFELHPDGSTRDSVSFTAVGAVGGLPGVLAARAVSSGGGRYAIVPTLEVYAPSGTTYQRIATMSAPTGLQLDGRLAGAPGLPWVTAINTDTTPGGTATAQYDVRSWSPAGARLGQLAGPSSASSVEALDANGSSYWLATSEMGGVISRLGITTTGTITSSAHVTVNDTVSGGQILSLHHTATGSAAAVIACGFSGTTDGWVMLIDAAASVVWSKQLPGTVIDDCASNAEGRVFVLRRDGLSEVAR